MLGGHCANLDLGVSDKGSLSPFLFVFVFNVTRIGISVGIGIE